MPRRLQVPKRCRPWTSVDRQIDRTGELRCCSSDTVAHRRKLPYPPVIMPPQLCSAASNEMSALRTADALGSSVKQ